MDTYNYENLKKNRGQINSALNKIINIKTEIERNSNSIKYNEIYTLLRIQTEKLESVENNLKSYIKGINKICGDTLEDNLEVKTDKPEQKSSESKETSEFKEYLDSNKVKILKYLNNKSMISLIKPNNNEVVYVTPKDIAESEEDILKSLGFDSEERKKLISIMFRERTDSEEDEFQKIINENDNVRVSAETFEASMFYLFDSVISDKNNNFSCRYMAKVKQEYEYTEDKQEFTLEQDTEYSYEIFSKYYDGNLNIFQMSLGEKEGTTCKIVKGKVIVSNKNFLFDSLKELGNNSFFHIIKKINQSKQDYLNQKYFNILMTNEQFGKWKYNGEVPEYIIEKGLSLIKSEYRDSYKNILDSSESEEQKQMVIDELTNIFINSIIFKDELTDEEKSYLINCTNNTQTATAFETREIIYEIEYGNSMSRKYDEAITSLGFENSEVVKILLFNQNRTPEETAFLEHTYSSQYYYETLDEKGNKIQVPYVSALDFEEFCLNNEESTVTIDYEKNEITITSKTYSTFEDFLISKYQLGEPVEPQIRTKTYSIKASFLDSTILRINTDNSSYECTNEIINNTDLGTIKGKEIDIELLYQTFGETLKETYGIDEDQFYNMFENDIVTENGYHTDDIVISMIIKLKRGNFKLTPELKEKVDSFEGKIDIESISATGNVTDFFGTLTSDAQIVGLKTAEGVGNWGENVGDAVISFGMIFDGSMVSQRAQEISNKLTENFENQKEQTLGRYILTNCGEDGLTSEEIYSMFEETIFGELDIPEYYEINGEKINVKELMTSTLGTKKDSATSELYRAIKNDEGESLEYIENIILYTILEDYSEYTSKGINQNINYQGIYDSEKLNERNEKLSKIKIRTVSNWFDENIWKTKYGNWLNEHSLTGGTEGILAQAAQSMGNNLPSIAIKLGLSAVLPPGIANAASEFSFFLSSYGASANEAINMGITDPKTINIYSSLNAGLEMFTEHFSPGGVVTENTVIGNLIENSNLNNISKILISAAGESEEEVFGWVLSPFVTYMSGISEKDLSECIEDGYSTEELGTTIASAFLSSLMLQGVNGGIQTLIPKNDYTITSNYNSLSTEQKTKISEEEYEQLIEEFNGKPESIRKLVFEKMNSEASTQTDDKINTEIAQALSCVLSGVSYENAYKSLSSETKEKIDFETFKSMKIEGLEGKSSQSQNTKEKSDLSEIERTKLELQARKAKLWDYIYAQTKQGKLDSYIKFSYGGKKVGGKLSNVVDFITKNGIKYDAMSFSKIELPNLPSCEEFFTRINETFGVDQGVLKNQFFYKPSIEMKEKYETLIIEAVKKHYENSEKTKEQLINIIKNCWDHFKNHPNDGFSYEFFTNIKEAIMEELDYEKAKEILSVFELKMRNNPVQNMLLGKLTSKGLSEINAKKLMSIIDSENGVCTYTARANAIFAAFQNNPEEFERTFGFPMYDANGNLNGREMLLNMYIELNTPEYGGELFGIDDGKVTIKSLDTSKQIFINKHEEVFKKWLESKNLSVKLDEILISDNIDGRLKKSDKVICDLSEGNTIVLGLKEGTVIHSEGENDITLTGGHSVMVTHIEGDRIYYSSWGSKCYITFEELDNSKLLGITTIKIDFEQSEKNTD